MATKGKAQPRLTIREVRSKDDPAFPAAHKLLRAAFPRSEVLPQRDWQISMREREHGLWTDIDWHLLVAQRGLSVIGAASGSYLGNVNIGIVGYIAVRPDARATGIGPRLRRRLGKAFMRDALRVTGRHLEAIIGEVRADNPWLRTLVRRDGAIALDFPYYQPSLGHKKDPVPLVLYYQPVGETKRSLSGLEVRRLLYTMWRRMYRVARPLSRPEFRRMIRSLEGRRRIGQRRI